MKKSSLPWRYALSGLVAMTMMAPAPAFAAASPSGAQQAESSTAKRTVTGTVVDAVDGEPLPGATVAVVGDKSAITATDIDGNFSLSIPAKKNVTLLVTYVGYKEMRVPIGDLGFVKVELKGDDNTLDEVVVVGSGTQKRVSVTGAITSVKGDDLKLPSTNLTNALAGKIAGVIAQTTSGEPGSAAEFYIRGIGTFGGRATPLILLDDVEISANDLNYVPAENIESFSILKDASATAIYGSRGANGVMIVKTKGGDYNSQTKIGVSFDASFNFLDKFPDFVDGARYMEMYNIARVSRGNDLRYTNDEIRWTRNGVNPYLYPDVNWGDILFRNMASRQRGNVNVSGGGSKVKYYMAIDVQHEDGLLNSEKLYSWNNNIQLYNYTFQNNISYKLTSSTTISMNMNAQVRQKSGPNAGAKDIFNYTLTTTPISFPVTWPAQEGDEHIRYASRRYSEHVLQNPYAVLNTSYSQTNETTLNTVVKLNQGLDFITKGLRFEAWVNLKSWSSMSFNRSITPYYYELAGRASNYMTNGELNPYKEGDIYRTNQIQTGTVYLNESALGRSTDQTFELQARFDWIQAQKLNKLLVFHGLVQLFFNIIADLVDLFKVLQIPARNPEHYGKNKTGLKLSFYVFYHVVGEILHNGIFPETYRYYVAQCQNNAHRRCGISNSVVVLAAAAGVRFPICFWFGLFRNRVVQNYKGLSLLVFDTRGLLLVQRRADKVAVYAKLGLQQGNFRLGGSDRRYPAARFQGFGLNDRVSLGLVVFQHRFSFRTGELTSQNVLPCHYKFAYA